MDDGWKWWAGTNEEYYHSSADTREEAIACLDGEGGYICEARIDPIALAGFIDADWIIERAEEGVERSENIDEVFEITPAQQADLQLRLREASDQWQLENGLVFKSDLFSSSRNMEAISADPE